MQNKSETLTNLGVAAFLAVLAVVFWDKVQGIAVFVVTLGLLVGIHEWGHFIAAKSVGVHVYEFALGFGPKLVTYMRRNGTEYTIRAIPLGGFVNPKGMQPDDPITADGINGRRPAERALVYLAGPLMNAILCVLVYCSLGAVFGGMDEHIVLVHQVTRKSAAERMPVVSVNGQTGVKHDPGLRPGDRILEVNGKPVDTSDSVTDEIHPNAGKPVTLKVRRGKDILDFTAVVPRGKQTASEFLTVTAVPAGTALALEPGDQVDKFNGKWVSGTAKKDAAEVFQDLLRQSAGKEVALVVWRKGTTRLEIKGPAGPVKAAIRPGERYTGMLGFRWAPGQGKRLPIGESIERGFGTLKLMLLVYGQMFSRPAELKENLSGPIGIGSQLSQSTGLPLMFYVDMLGQLSFSLALFNLLPVPILDGGHLLLLSIEVVRRRRLNAASQRTAAMVGLAIVGTLAIIITCQDIIRRFL
jgi:regulator of sigma E protease